MAFKQQGAEYWSAKLELQKHPEGGWYKEVYRSAELLNKDHLPPRFGADRNFCISIYFMLEGTDFSALHRIKSDELWHFYAGSPLAVSVISEQGTYSEILLGDNPELGQVFQAMVPAGAWFGSRVTLPGSFSLVGCTVSPGFDFADFEMGDRNTLQEKFPAYADIIKQLTRENTESH